MLVYIFVLLSRYENSVRQGSNRDYIMNGKSLKKYVLALDLIDDSVLIQEYEKLHENVWPEIEATFPEAGIVELEIYRFQTRMIMIMTVNETFSFERKNTMDLNNPKVQEWEELMWKYQKAVPGAKLGEKWVLMDKIYEVKK